MPTFRKTWEDPETGETYELDIEFSVERAEPDVGVMEPYAVDVSIQSAWLGNQPLPTEQLAVLENKIGEDLDDWANEQDF